MTKLMIIEIDGNLKIVKTVLSSTNVHSYQTVADIDNEVTIDKLSELLASYKHAHESEVEL